MCQGPQVFLRRDRSPAPMRATIRGRSWLLPVRARPERGTMRRWLLPDAVLVGPQGVVWQLLRPLKWIRSTRIAALQASTQGAGVPQRT